VHIAGNSGSIILLWQCCDTSYTAIILDDVMFAHKSHSTAQSGSAVGTMDSIKPRVWHILHTYIHT